MFVVLSILDVLTRHSRCLCVSDLLETNSIFYALDNHAVMYLVVKTCCVVFAHFAVVFQMWMLDIEKVSLL